jgi:hypothetical protein
VNVTVIVQLELAASVAGPRGQASVAWKSPLTVMLLMVSAALPEFVSWTVRPVLLEPMLTAPKSRPGGLKVTPGPRPVPLNGTVCGLPAASSVIVSSPLRVPPPWGEKVTETTQLIVGLSDAGHVLDEKSPVVLIPPMLSVSVPVLVNVTVLAALVVPTACDPKLRLVGLIERTGATPVPASEITCGLPAAFSVTVSVPLLAPIAVGVKVMLTRQLDKGAIVVQLTLATAKSPDAVALAIVIGSGPLLNTATSSEALVTPTRLLPKFSDVGLTSIG